MLDSLEAGARGDRGRAARQRQFVADASHELRTPLTSILANLELLTDVLDGERGEAAQLGPALLAAHAPPGRRPAAARPRRRQAASSRASRPTLAHVLVEAAAELGPVADGPPPRRRRRRRRWSRARATSFTAWRSTSWRTPSATRPTGRACAPRSAPRTARSSSPSQDDGPGRAARAARAHLRALRARRGRPRLVQRPRPLDRARRGRVARRQRRASRTPRRARASSCACRGRRFRRPSRSRSHRPERLGQGLRCRITGVAGARGPASAEPDRPSLISMPVTSPSPKAAAAEVHGLGNGRA